MLERAPARPPALLHGTHVLLAQVRLEHDLEQFSFPPCDPAAYLQRLLTIPQLPAPRQRLVAPPCALPPLRIEPITDPIRARYDGWLRQLARRLHRLRRARPNTGEDSDETPPIPEEIPTPTLYPTLAGALTFDDLYQQTQRRAATVLRYRLLIDEVDDGLQAGYLALWRRLAKDADRFHDKPHRWISTSAAFAAAHALRGNLRFKQHCDRSGAESHDLERLNTRPHYERVSTSTHAHESRQADVRLDLQAAISAAAQHILNQPSGKAQDRQLWALYSMTMLHVHVTEFSRLFNVPIRSASAAYETVRTLLQAQLAEYKPKGKTRRVHGRGQPPRPAQDYAAIRAANAETTAATYEHVRQLILQTHADTTAVDLLALAGIEDHIPAQVQGRTHGISPPRIQRAYQRVHLMIGTQRDPQVQMRRPVKRTKRHFILTLENTPLVQQVAAELLQDPKSQPKLVALHAYISNLPVSATAKHFGIPTPTLRNYVNQIAVRFST